jgi:hypothetical protein
VRSSDRYAGIWANWQNMAAGSKNAAGGQILTCVVKGTIQTGHGRVVGTVDVVVSALDTTEEEEGGVELKHLPEITRQFLMMEETVITSM